jgi:hypothetical protein
MPSNCVIRLAPSLLLGSALAAGLPSLAGAAPPPAEDTAPPEELATDDPAAEGPAGGDQVAVGVVPPAIEVVNLPKTRHNVYGGFGVMGGVTNFDTYQSVLAGGLSLNFRMGGRVNEAFSIGGQLYTQFSLRFRAGATGGLLLEFSVFPLKKRNNQGLALHFGLGAVSYTHAIPDASSCSTVDITQCGVLPGVSVTHGGATTMWKVGWDFWLQKAFNIGLHARLDASLVSFPTRPLLLFPGLELAMNWY